MVDGIIHIIKDVRIKNEEDVKKRYQSAILLMGLTLGGLFVGTTVAATPTIPAQAAAATTTLQGTIGEGVHWTLKDVGVGYELHLNGGTLPDNPVDLAELVKPGQDVQATDNPWINDILKQTNLSRYAITKIVFDGPVKTGRNAQFLFGGLRSLKAIEHLDRLDTSQATTMAGMFYMDESLNNAADNYELDVSHFDTANVTDMSYMFNELHYLHQIDVAGFDTRQVTTMNHMFAATESLQFLDVAHFQTGRVTDMGDMFSGCGMHRNDITLNVANFDTRQVTNMAGMFSMVGAKNLALTFDTSKVRDMSRMFWGAKNLTSLDMSHLDTSQVTNMAKMFGGLTLTSLHLDTLNTARVTNMYRMFADDAQLTTLTLPNFQTENVTDMGGMFSGDTALTDLDIRSFRTGKVVNMAEMFQQDPSLTSLDVSNFDTRQVLNMRGMFAMTSQITRLDLRNFATPNVVWLTNMFMGMSNLQQVDLSSAFQTGNVTDMAWMFAVDPQLTTVDVSHFDTSKVMNLQTMFVGDSCLKQLNLANWNLQGPRSIDADLQQKLGDMLDGYTGAGVALSVERVNEAGMFYGTDQLAQLTLGPRTWLNADDPSNFEDNPDNPNPMLGNPPVSTAYTGKWQAVGKGTPENPQGPDSLTSSELVTRYGGATQPAGSVTYVWQPTDDHRPTLPVDPGTPVDPEKPVDPGTPVDPTPDPGTPTPIVPPVTPTPEVPVNASINAVRKVGLYRKPTFTAANRVTWYAKRPRTRQPQFVVTGKATSRNGAARYKVRDVNRHSRTYRLTGYVTTRAAYVQPTYYARTQAAKTITVLNPRGVNGYRRANLTGKVGHYRQGQSLRVKRLVTHNLTTRFQLTNGQYVTANRQLVQTGRHTMPRRITAKRTFYRYRDVNFRRRVGQVKPGQTLTVLGWDYSDHGTVRYRVAGGYVTANRQFIR